MTVLLNTYFEMSVNRRLLMKPFIDRRYHQLCNRNEDIGESKLFADVGKRLKDIQAAQRINRNYMSKNSMRGRSFPTFRQQMRGYPRRGQWSNRGRGNTSNLQKVQSTGKTELLQLKVDSFSYNQKAGILRHYVNKWSQITDDEWILKAIAGYEIEFTQKPFQTTFPVTPNFKA